MKIKDSRANYIRFISKFSCAQRSKYRVTFDSEVDSNDDAIGRSHYEWFAVLNYAGENLVIDVVRIFKNTFCERTCIKHENKRKSCESSERRFNNPLLRRKDLQAKRLAEVIERPGVFRDRNHRIN